MLVISDKQTSYRSREGTPLAEIDNVLVFAPIDGEVRIIAAGGPSQWHSTDPLPPEAIVTDLVAASLQDTDAASELWSNFLPYVVCKACQGRWSFFRMRFFALPVRVSMAHGPARAAVLKAIAGCKYPRLRIDTY